MTRYNLVLLLVAMIGAGLLGGAANYLLLYKDDPEYAHRSRSFVLGLVAAVLSPLFLKAISSEMIDRISTIRYGSGLPFDYFVFTSLCLLAAMFSRTFAETVAKRLAAEVEKARKESQEARIRAAIAEEKAREAEPALRTQVETLTEPLAESSSQGIPTALQDLAFDQSDRELLTALCRGRYSYRTVDSLAEEIRMEEPDAIQRLERMRDQALAGKKTTPRRSLWFLTDKGCDWLAAREAGQRTDGTRLVS